MRLNPKAFVACLIATACSTALAQSADPMRDVVAKALAQNPDVTARLNAYRAATDAVAIGRAGWYPRLDLSAGVGQDRDTITSRAPETQTLNRSEAALQLSQLLWDGLSTRNEVSRLTHERLARYFELLDVTETTAFEAWRAYHDVVRTRQLVRLAEDTYVEHRTTYLKIQSRVAAGVGRGVDLEQAAARLAQAESNLTTEITNLHDVSSRYQRIVGEAPPGAMRMAPALTTGVPGTSQDTVVAALQRSPAISASIEGLRAAQSGASIREAAFQPRVEAIVRSGGGNNYEAILDRTRGTTAGIVLNWNLFNGGADQARVRQAASLVNQAADQRDRVCRDVRQNASIAFNDTRRLAELVEQLKRNVLAIEKTRDAYRQQFDIGQRSLLDLLNSESEVYSARRALTNAEFDLNTAYARTQAAIAQLTAQLGIARAEAADEATNWSAGNDLPSRCELQPLDFAVTPRADLDARAQRIADTAPMRSVPGTPAPAAAVPANPAPPAPASRP